MAVAAEHARHAVRALRWAQWYDDAATSASLSCRQDEGSPFSLSPPPLATNLSAAASSETWPAWGMLAVAQAVASCEAWPALGMLAVAYAYAVASCEADPAWGMLVAGPRMRSKLAAISAKVGRSRGSTFRQQDTCVRAGSGHVGR